MKSYTVSATHDTSHASQPQYGQWQSDYLIGMGCKSTAYVLCAKDKRPHKDWLQYDIHTNLSVYVKHMSLPELRTYFSFYVERIGHRLLALRSSTLIDKSEIVATQQEILSSIYMSKLQWLHIIEWEGETKQCRPSYVLSKGAVLLGSAQYGIYLRLLSATAGRDRERERELF